MAMNETGSHRKTGPAGSSALWGGRFSSEPSEVMERINASIDFDKRLYAHDIGASKAHCEMLVACGIVGEADGEAILSGLDRVLAEIEGGTFAFSRAREDIHMNVETRLTELIGPAAGRLHTARSRNDQVATDLRLWLRDTIDGADAALRDLQSVLIDRAEQHAASVMPGLTHLQAAQPITLGHHLLAYVEMLGRDRGRLADARRRLNECPLGAAALAGTPYPIDRERTAAALGFDRPAANALDAVSDRDFVLEFLAAAAIAASHLSRLGEELVLWCSAQFGFLRLGDAFTTGSSIMPQKRNPDAAELVRAKTGRIVGALTTLSIVMKGLPLAYSKDMQEDKEPLFDAADTLGLAISAMTGMMQDAKFDTDAMREAAEKGFVTATDLADWLVRERGTPFREAHRITGALVKCAEEAGCDLADLPLETLKTVEPGLTGEIYDVLRVESAVAARNSPGGTAPARVLEGVRAARERFL